jgi:hypothetical protein
MSAFDVVTDAQSNGAREPDAVPGSALARARAAAARAREQRTLDLAVGGSFGERLVVRYGTLGIDELDHHAELVESGTTASSLSLDMIVRAARTVLWREDDGELIDFEVGLDHRLWTLLDWPLPAGIDDPVDVTTRDLLDALFERNALRLEEHLSVVTTWMRKGGDDVGEASGATF